MSAAPNVDGEVVALATAMLHDDQESAEQILAELVDADLAGEALWVATAYVVGLLQAIGDHSTVRPETIMAGIGVRMAAG